MGGFPDELLPVIERYDSWSRDHLLAVQDATTITTPLYHYTDEAGLRGILQNQEFWLTSYVSLNDTSELKFGIDAAATVLADLGSELINFAAAGRQS